MDLIDECDHIIMWDLVNIKNKEGVVVIRNHLDTCVRHHPCSTSYHNQSILELHVQEYKNQAKRGIFCEESFLSSLDYDKKLEE